MAGLEWCEWAKGDVVPLGEVGLRVLGGVEWMSPCESEDGWLA